MLDKAIALRNAKTIYRNNDHCIKVFNSEYTKDSVYSEAFNQTRAEQLGVTVPKVISVEKFEGKWSIVSEFIPGTTLSKIIHDDPTHSADAFSTLVKLHIQTTSVQSTPLINTKDKMIHRISSAEIDETTRTVLLNRLEKAPRMTHLCHGDFVPSNILISDNGTPYILDWAHAGCGDPLADAAAAYLNISLEMPEYASMYLELYCTTASVSPQEILFYVPLIAACGVSNYSTHRRARLLQIIDQYL